MNTPFFNAEEVLEHGQSLIKKQVQTTVQNATSQVTGQTQTPSDAASGSGGGDKMTQDFIKDMYGMSDATPQAAQNQQTPQASAQQSGGSDDPVKLAEARQKLKAHQDQHTTTYYNPTFEQRPHQEERAAEKIEREENEEKQKRWELQQEEAKKNEVPIALKMAKNKAEQFRGAAG